MSKFQKDLTINLGYNNYPQIITHWNTRSSTLVIYISDKKKNKVDNVYFLKPVPGTSELILERFEK